jgi:hypothetical protein
MLSLFIHKILYYTCLLFEFTIIFSSLFYQEVTFDEYTYPSWALTLGWMAVVMCLAWLPYMFLVETGFCGTWNVCVDIILLQ